jgi:MFS transporter, Spinster family, sphingosine-1-phosphate transporter
MVERGAWRLLLALAALNVLAFVDRQLVAALAPVLMGELGLSRADIGLLIGPVFVVVLGVGTLFLGAAADRARRPRIIAGGLAAWSLATALTGTAAGFATLALWRALVGVGEASLPPTAVSMLGDRFPRSRLGFATSVYYAGIPVGFACSLALAGWLVPRFGWRSCFYLLGVLGLAGVALVWRMADPPRRARAAEAAGEEPAAGGRIAGRLRRVFAHDPALALLITGATLLTYASASSQHLVTWLVQERGLPYSRAAYLASAVVLGAGLVGSLALGGLTDAAERRRPDGRLFAFVGLGALSFAASAVFYLLPTASPFFLAAWLVAQAWALGWFGPMLAAIHDRAPSGARATVIGFSLMAINLVGVGTGPWITGAIGDRAGLTAGLLTSVAVGAVGLGFVGLAASRAGGRVVPRDFGRTGPEESAVSAPAAADSSSHGQTKLPGMTELRIVG